MIDRDAAQRQGLVAPEDAEVLALCERIGYGAVMDSAARQWRRKDAVGAFVVGPCVATLQQALREMGEAGPAKDLWTTDKPTAPGWYWLQAAKHLQPIIVCLHMDNSDPESVDGWVVDFAGDERHMESNKIVGEWQGPIEPKE